MQGEDGDGVPKIFEIVQTADEGREGLYDFGREGLALRVPADAEPSA